jgi:hypothetical protein
VGDHAADGLVEDTARGAEVEGTRAGGVDNVALCLLACASGELRVRARQCRRGDVSG